MDVNMVLGVCCVFLGIFLNFSLQHFRFSVAFSPFLGLFWPSEGRFLTFFPSLMPAAFRSGKKVKKRPSSGQKRPKNGLQATEKRKCFRHQFKKMPKKNTTHPQNHISVHFYLFSNKRQRYIPYGQLACILCQLGRQD